MARALSALHVFARFKVGHLFTGAEHELLLGLISRASSACSISLPGSPGRGAGRAAGEVLGGGLQPVGGGAQARVVGEVAMALSAGRWWPSSKT